jgi:hypothetical protein
MFNKKKKEVWLVIEKHDYSNVSSSFRVAKVAYSLDDAVAFKVSLDQLNESSNESFFIATDVNNAMNKVIDLHNKKVG